MARFESLNDTHLEFIESQKVFFVGTAASEGTINISPKGMDSLRVPGPNRVIWLNLTGSGNETAAHILDTNRITLMFCAFSGPPKILRLQGRGEPVFSERSAADWQLIRTPTGRVGWIHGSLLRNWTPRPANAE